MTYVGGSLLLMTVTPLLLQMRCHTLWQTGTLSSRVEWTCQGYCNNCHLYQGSIMHTVQMCCSYRHKSKAPFIYYINFYCTLWFEHCICLNIIFQGANCNVYRRDVLWQLTCQAFPHNIDSRQSAALVRHDWGMRGLPFTRSSLS